MVEVFIAALMTIVMSITVAVGGAVPASKDSNPSDEAKASNAAVSEYVEENHPTGISSNAVAIGLSANLGVSDRTPEEPKEEGKVFGEAVSDEANADNPQGSQAEENSGFGTSVASSQPESVKADGRAFGIDTSNSRRP